MMKVELYNQGAAPWGAMKMGASEQTIARGGCNVTCISMGLRNFSVFTDPGKLVTDLGPGGFMPDGYPDFGKIQTLYPSVTWLGQNQTTVNPIATYSHEHVEVSLARVRRAIARGFLVMLGVSLIPDAPTDFQDHFVLAHDFHDAALPEDVDFTVNDPAFGDTIRFSQRYGPAKRGLFSYMIFVGPAIGFPDHDALVNESGAAWKISMCLKAIPLDKRPYPASTYLPEALDALVR